ncbi:MAG TPA: universal stress protein [Pseudomonadales bacterium]
MSSTSFKSILVAVRDPNARTQHAIRKAAAIATATGARVTLFHAFSAPYPLPKPVPTDPHAILRMAAKERRAELLKLARALRARGITVRCEVVWDFPPAHAIVRHVIDTKPDLVVAESHRHTRVARWFLANSDWELIRECPCPVWFVKRERLAKNAVILTAIDPAHARAKPSGLDDRLLSAATSVTDQLGGSVAAIHVENTLQLIHADPVPMATIRRLATRHGVAAEACLVRTGNPADEIVASVAELDADLLVMGAVSRSGLGHAHIGHTAEAVIDAVTCDVLVVKPRGFKSAVARKGPKLPDGIAGK